MYMYSYHWFSLEQIQIQMDKEQEYVFPVVFHAREIKPYVLTQSELKYWIVCNEIDSDHNLTAINLISIL